MKCQPWMMWIFVNCAIHSLWVYLLFLSQIIQVCIMLNKSTWGVKKCGANQKQHCKQAGAIKRFDIS